MDVLNVLRHLNVNSLPEWIPGLSGSNCGNMSFLHNECTHEKGKEKSALRLAREWNLLIVIGLSVFLCPCF